MQSNPKPCRACGEPYPDDVPVCPRCRVPRKGDVNKPAVIAYSIFLALMLVMFLLVLHYSQR